MSRYNIDDFSDQELDYYSRTLLLKDMGLKAQKRLKNSTVCIVGLGGLGSPVAIQLASLGVGKLLLIDSDVVEISNLQRQNLYSAEQVGIAKVEAAAQRITSMNPFIEVKPIPLAITPLNAKELIKGANVVVGALDRMAPRYALNRACVKQKIPLIHGAAITYMGNITTLIPGKTACLECFQGGIDDSKLPSCAIVGVHPSLVNIVGSIMASETVRLLIGAEPILADKLLFVDLEDLSFETIKLKKVDSCPVCRELNPEPNSLSYSPILEVCGREGRRVFVFQTEKDLNLSLDSFIEKLEESNYSILARGELGFSFIGSKGEKGSLLKSGVTILEGFNDKDSALNFHNRLFDSSCLL